jgi:hypothetical protein
MILGRNTRGDGKVLCLFLCSSIVYNEGRSPLFLSFSSQQSNYIMLRKSSQGSVVSVAMVLGLVDEETRVERNAPRFWERLEGRYVVLVPGRERALRLGKAD